MEGYTLTQAFRNGVLSRTPIWSLWFTRYREKKKKWMVGTSPGSTTIAVDFGLESI